MLLILGAIAIQPASAGSNNYKTACNAPQVISLLQKSIRIPSDLAKYLEIDEKSKVEMIPLSKKRFLIEVK
jgi:hypothetical protein